MEGESVFSRWQSQYLPFLRPALLASTSWGPSQCWETRPPGTAANALFHFLCILGLQEVGEFPAHSWPENTRPGNSGLGVCALAGFYPRPWAGGLDRTDSLRLTFMEQKSFATEPGSKCLPSSLHVPCGLDVSQLQSGTWHVSTKARGSLTSPKLGAAGTGPICRRKDPAEQMAPSGLFRRSYSLHEK